jgi:hypothetical protein
LRLPDGDRASCQRKEASFLRDLGKAAERLGLPSGRPQELIAGLYGAGCDEQGLIALLATATTAYRAVFRDRHQSTGIRYDDFIRAFLSGRLSRHHFERLPKWFKKQIADARGKTIDDLSKAIAPAVAFTPTLGKRASLHAAVERTLVRWVLSMTKSKRGCKAKTRWLLCFASELATPGAAWISFEPRAFDLRMKGNRILPPQTLADLGAVFLRTYEPEE